MKTQIWIDKARLLNALAEMALMRINDRPGIAPRIEAAWPRLVRDLWNDVDAEYATSGEADFDALYESVNTRIGDVAPAPLGTVA